MIEQADQAKRERALQFAGMSAQLNTQNADAQITLAWVLYQLGRVADAEQALRSGLKLGNPSPDSSYLVAKILIDQNKTDTAKQLSRQRSSTSRRESSSTGKKLRRCYDKLKQAVIGGAIKKVIASRSVALR